MTAPGRARSFAAQVPDVFGVVFGNPRLRRVELAFAGFSAAEWAVWVAMIVYAYDRGGATTAGLVAVAQLVPSAVFAPFAAALGDRYRSGRVLFWGYVAQALGMGVTAAVLLADGPALAAYGFAACAATAVTITRPTQAALVAHARPPSARAHGGERRRRLDREPDRADRPGARRSHPRSGSPGWVFAVMAVAVSASAVLVLPVPGPPPSRAGDEETRVLRETFEALAVLRAEPSARALIVILGFSSVAFGALDILYAELAIGRLGLSDGWAGYLNAAFGLGGLVAIVVTASFVGRRLAPALL